MTRVHVGPLSEIPLDRCLAIAEGRVAVARVGGDVVAFENRCLHQASPLDGGYLKNGVLVCPLHFWRYELPRARHIGTGAELVQYPVELADGEVWVDVPAPPVPMSMRERLLEHAREWDTTT